MIDPEAKHWFTLRQHQQLAHVAYWSPHSEHADQSGAERAQSDLLSIWPRNRYQVVECRVVPAMSARSEHGGMS